jgi:alkylated DNA repair protein alkB family protein 6
MDFAGLLKAEKAERAREQPGAEARRVLISYGDASPPLSAPSRASHAEWPLPRVDLELSLHAHSLRLDAVPTHCGGPRDVCYAPEFLSMADESLLRAALLHPAFASTWTTLRGRSLLVFGGTPTVDGLVGDVALPQCCEAVCDALVRTGVFPACTPPNHVLVNRYRPGQGLMPHQDGPLYSPLVAIVSLGGPAALDFWSSAAHAVRGRPECGGELPAASLLLQPRSLLVFYGDAYRDFYHGIAERMADSPHAHTANATLAGVCQGAMMERGDRISLTVRHVPSAGAPELCTAPGTAVAASDAQDISQRPASEGSVGQVSEQTND